MRVFTCFRGSLFQLISLRIRSKSADLLDGLFKPTGGSAQAKLQQPSKGKAKAKAKGKASASTKSEAKRKAAKAKSAPSSSSAALVDNVFDGEAEVAASSMDSSVTRTRLWIDEVLCAFKHAMSHAESDSADVDFESFDILRPMIMAVSFCFVGQVSMIGTLTSTGQPVVVKSWSVLRPFLQQIIREQVAPHIDAPHDSTDGGSSGIAKSLISLIAAHGLDALSFADEAVKLHCYKIAEDFLHAVSLQQAPVLHARAKMLVKKRFPHCAPA